MIISFGYTILYVPHVPSSVNFYTRALGFVVKFITPEGDYGELVSGSTTLAFASHQLAGSHFVSPTDE
jgi:lactoylglutathione lyase